MYCERLGVTKQCFSEKVIKIRGFLPITKTECKREKPKRNFISIDVNDRIYNDLKCNYSNPTVYEYEKILEVIRIVYRRTPREKKDNVLDIVEKYFRRHGESLLLNYGIIISGSEDYIFFYNSTEKAKEIRWEVFHGKNS